MHSAHKFRFRNMPTMLLNSLAIAERQKSVLYVAFIICFLAQIWIGLKVADNSDALDFRLIWLAGNLWSEGLNPYGPAFADRYFLIFGEGPVSHFWVYPPNWWPLAVLLGSLKFPLAALVWNVINYACLVVGTWLIFPKKILAFVLLLTFLSLMQDVSVAISIGQTAMLVFLGVSAFMHGWRYDRPWVLFLGLVILSLKPNIAIIFFFLSMLRADLVRPALAAGAIALIATLPVLSEQSIMGFLNAIGRYSAPGIAANNAENMTGLWHLFDLIGISLPPLLLIALALIIAMIVAKRSIALAIATIAFLVPMHTYDLAFVMVLVPFLMPASIIASIGFLLLWRTANIGVLTGIVHPGSAIFPGSLMASLGLLIIFIAFAWGTYSRPRSIT